MPILKILALGDVVSDSGCRFIRSRLWDIRREKKLDAVIINGENSAVGNGIDKTSADMLFAAGADVITTGNHVWRKKGVEHLFETNTSVLRPANYPPSCPGSGYTTVDCRGYRLLVVNLLGTVFMDSMDSPFLTLEKILERENGAFDLSIVDFHAEATSEKIALALHFDGKISAVFGTHTHVQTNDARVLPGGTGFISDAGMTGVENSVLGLDSSLMIKKFITKMPQYHNVAEGEVTMHGVIFSIDTDSGKCVGAEAIKEF